MLTPTEMEAGRQFSTRREDILSNKKKMLSVAFGCYLHVFNVLYITHLSKE